MEIRLLPVKCRLVAFSTGPGLLPTSACGLSRRWRTRCRDRLTHAIFVAADCGGNERLFHSVIGPMGDLLGFTGRQ
jgi:hypothetical protein